MSGQIWVVTGPSGVGKGTLCGLLLKETPGLQLSISATSRAMRAGEQEGVHYFFKSRAAFETWIEQDGQEPDLTRHALLEWAEYNGNYYGTPRAGVEASLRAGADVLLEIDAQGALQVKRKFPQACLIFIAPPSLAVLEARLRGRGTESEAEVARRLEIARNELALQSQFDVVVQNNELETALRDLKQAMCARSAL